jgi:surfactin synthase thioesterase subunit
MSWIVRYRVRPKAQISVVCIPHAGGGAAAFRHWSKLFPAEFEVFGVEPAGRGSRFSEPALRVLNDIADAVAEAILRLPERPLILFGHSMGATVAFEVSRRLRLLSPATPQCLCVSGAAAPQIPSERAIIHRLPHDAFVARIAELAGIEDALLADQEFVELFEPVLRADFEAIETYRYSVPPALTVPIAAFAGARDLSVPFDHLQRWSELTVGPFTTLMLNGGHFYLREEAAAVIEHIVGFCRSRFAA